MQTNTPAADRPAHAGAAGRSAPAARRVLSFDAIGTHWVVDAEDVLAQDVRERVHAVIDDFDRTWSRFGPTPS